MRDNYVGDVGDFANNGLLRWLGGMREVPPPTQRPELGIVWYYNRHPEQNQEGNILPAKELRECDPELFDQLLHLRDNNGTVQGIIGSDILPRGTLSFDTEIPIVQRNTLELRQHWLECAIEATQYSQIVFVNPDNGLAGRTKHPHHQQGYKYATIEELRNFTCRGKSLVLYHHSSQGRYAPERIRDLSSRLRRGLGLHVRSLWFHRGTARFYFIAIQPVHRDYLDERLRSFSRSRWCTVPRFTIVPSP